MIEMFTVKNFYRILISLGSVIGFALGWVFLAHAPKPVQASNQSQTNLSSPTGQDPLPTLEPLNFSRQRRTTQVNPGFQQRSFSGPRLRSGGS
jgi:hypothetical protein